MEGDSVNKKKKTVIVLALLLLLLAAVGGTYAYFTYEGRATNVITTGTVEIMLEEKMLVDGEEQSYPEDTITDVMPGTTRSKIPYVENVGTASCYVRAKATVKIVGADGEELPLVLENEEPVLSFDVDGETWVPAADAETGEEWYICKTVLNPAADAESSGDRVKLFSTVAFSPDMGNEYQGCTVTIDVVAQAVQVKNNEMTGDDVTTILGWPAETTVGEE